MITRRDLVVAFAAIAATLCIVAVAEQKAPIMQSAAFDWNSIPVKQTAVGSTRSFFRAPTATLDQLELHVTTLNPDNPPILHINIPTRSW